MVTARKALPELASWVGRYVPALTELRGYTWATLGADLMAGLTVATVAVPQAMAYATLAGLPPQFGLYTAIVMTTVGALLASSRLLINGPTNAISIALLSALAAVPEEERAGAAVLVACLVGVAQLGIALLRLGDLTRYVSPSVFIGFAVGAGALLVLDQTKNLLGMAARGGPEDHFLVRFWLSLSLGTVHWPTFLLGLGTIALVLLLRWLNGIRQRRGARFPIPQHLVAVLLMAALVREFRFDEQFGVQVIGPIPSALPAFQMPEFRWDQVRLLAGNAFALAVLGLLEALAMAKTIANRTGQPLDMNQQCLSEGAANLAGCFFQCIPGSGSLTRSAVNVQAGAVTQWSGVFSAGGVAVLVLLFAPLARYIPQASLAGLLMLATFRMVDREHLMFHLRATRFDAGVVIATALAAVFISVELCIVIGVFLSFALYIPRAAHVRMVRIAPGSGLPGGTECELLWVYEVEGDLFFGSAPKLEKHFAAIESALDGEARIVVLTLKRARTPDAAFLGLLQMFALRLAGRNVALVLCEVQPDLCEGLQGVGLSGPTAPCTVFADTTGDGASYRAAVDFSYQKLGAQRCAGCPRRTNAQAEPPLEFSI